MAKKPDAHPDPVATNGGQQAAAPADAADEAAESNDEVFATAATVGVVAVGALVFEAALEEDVEERVVPVRASNLARGRGHFERRAMAAAQELREVGRGEDEAVAGLTHVDAWPTRAS